MVGGTGYNNRTARYIYYCISIWSHAIRMAFPRFLSIHPSTAVSYIAGGFLCHLSCSQKAVINYWISLAQTQAIRSYTGVYVFHNKSRTQLRLTVSLWCQRLWALDRCNQHSCTPDLGLARGYTSLNHNPAIQQSDISSHASE